MAYLTVRHLFFAIVIAYNSNLPPRPTRFVCEL